MSDLVSTRGIVAGWRAFRDRMAAERDALVARLEASGADLGAVPGPLLLSPRGAIVAPLGTPPALLRDLEDFNRTWLLVVRIEHGPEYEELELAWLATAAGFRDHGVLPDDLAFCEALGLERWRASRRFERTPGDRALIAWETLDLLYQGNEERAALLAEPLSAALEAGRGEAPDLRRLRRSWSGGDASDA